MVSTGTIKAQIRRQDGTNNGRRTEFEWKWPGGVTYLEFVLLNFPLPRC